MSNKLVIYHSLSGNTKKVAEAIAQGAGASCLNVNEVDEKDLLNSEVIFLGSGIYMGKHHQQLIRFVDRIPLTSKIYIFSTAGMPLVKFVWHKSLRDRLRKRRIKIIGDVCIKGFDTFGPLKWFRGINKGRPNENDLKRAIEIGKKY